MKFKKFLPNARSQRFMFSYRTFVFSDFTFRPMILFGFAYVASFSSKFSFLLFIWCPIVPAPIEKTTLSHWIAIVFLSKNQLTIYIWIYFSIISIDSLPILTSSLLYLNYSSFIMNLKIRKHESPNYILFQSCLAILSLLQFYVNLRISFPISRWKKSLLWIYRSA